MLSEDNSVRYCVTTKYKSKPEYIPDKKYKPFKTEKKKKNHKVNARIFLYFTSKSCFYFHL